MKITNPICISADHVAGASLSRTVYKILFCLSIFSLLVGCARSSPAATQSTVESQTSGEVERIAQTVVEQLGKGEYSAVFNRFDNDMKNAFPEAQLKSTWEQIIAQVGRFQKSTDLYATVIQGHQIVIVTCQFEKDLLDIQLGFNEQSQIVGFSFAETQAAPAKPAYANPSYSIAGSFSGLRSL